MKSALASTLFCVAVALCGSCAQRGNAPPQDLAAEAAWPRVAAQYRTHLVESGVRQVIDWRFWRDADRAISENLSDKTSEEWQRDGVTLFLKRYFHEDRRGIEFQMDDLRIAGKLPKWQQQALLLDPAVVGQLRARDGGWFGDKALRHYSGDVAGVRWDIVLRVDLMLPLSIERRQGTTVERTELVESHTLESAPWRPTPTADYPLIDYADLGDMTADAFVQKVHTRFGGDHGH